MYGTKLNWHECVYLLYICKAAAAVEYTPFDKTISSSTRKSFIYYIYLPMQCKNAMHIFVQSNCDMATKIVVIPFAHCFYLGQKTLCSNNKMVMCVCVSVCVRCNLHWIHFGFVYIRPSPSVCALCACAVHSVCVCARMRQRTNTCAGAYSYFPRQVCVLCICAMRIHTMWNTM